MKTSYVVITAIILIGLSCDREATFSVEEKKLVESEIREFMDNIEGALESASADEYFNKFIHTEELAVATQGQLVTDPKALRDTINLHLAMVEKQSIKTTNQKIFVIDEETVVLSTAKVTAITFKNGEQITIPYAWTLLLVKREGKWKIAHIHN